jgi:hypothetical protein
VINICGGKMTLCEECESDGFSVYNGKGDGMFYLSKNEHEIDKYNHKVAYDIKYTDLEIHNLIMISLIDESLPQLENVPTDELKGYFDYLVDFEFIKKDEDGCWSCEGFVEVFNSFSEEMGEKRRLSHIRGSHPIVKDFYKSCNAYFSMFANDEPYIIYFDVENVQFGFYGIQ